VQASNIQQISKSPNLKETQRIKEMAGMLEHATDVHAHLTIRGVEPGWEIKEAQTTTEVAGTTIVNVLVMITGQAALLPHHYVAAGTITADETEVRSGIMADEEAVRPRHIVMGGTGAQHPREISTTNVLCHEEIHGMFLTCRLLLETNLTGKVHFIQCCATYLFTRW